MPLLIIALVVGIVFAIMAFMSIKSAQNAQTTDSRDLEVTTAKEGIPRRKLYGTRWVSSNVHHVWNKRKIAVKGGGAKK